MPEDALIAMAFFSGCEDPTDPGSSDQPQDGGPLDARSADGSSGDGSSSSSDTGSDTLSSSPTDAASDADAAIPDAEAGTPDAEAGTPDAEAGAPDADSGADSGTVTQADGTFAWGVWTCGQGGTTKDIKAFAMSLGIQSVLTTITGATGKVDVVYSATCTRTTVLTSVEYPSAGTIKTTAAGAFTCTATCAPVQCTAGAQAVVVDTFALSGGSSTYTYTRVLDAAYLVHVSLQKAAGCVADDTEIATRIKQ